MDNINHPKHYASGKIEVIEAIEDWKMNFHKGNAIKYIARAGKKDLTKEIEDLEKARWYLQREIENLKAQSENRSSVKPKEMAVKLDAYEHTFLQGTWCKLDSEEMAFIPDSQHLLRGLITPGQLSVVKFNLILKSDTQKLEPESYVAAEKAGIEHFNGA